MRVPPFCLYGQRTSLDILILCFFIIYIVFTRQFVALDSKKTEADFSASVFYVRKRMTAVKNTSQPVEDIKALFL